MAQDDLHLLATAGRIEDHFMASADRVRALHRTGAPRFSAAAAANAAAVSGAQRARRQLCLLLSLAVACRASPLPCYPHRRPRRPPPAKCRGNEVGAKMTGSISDFWSGTYASVAVPRELALIVLRSAAERIGPKPRSVS